MQKNVTERRLFFNMSGQLPHAGLAQWLESLVDIQVVIRSTRIPRTILNLTTFFDDF